MFCGVRVSANIMAMAERRGRYIGHDETQNGNVTQFNRHSHVYKDGRQEKSGVTRRIEQE